MTPSLKRRVFATLLVATLVAAVGYDVVAALKWTPVGSEPGDESFADGLAPAAGALAMIGALAYFVALAARDQPGYWVDALIPAASAALMVAHFYTFDPYYFPDRQRYSENEFINPAWVFGVAVSAVVASIALVVWRRGGRGLAVVVVLLSLGTLMLEGGGH